MSDSRNTLIRHKINKMHFKLMKTHTLTTKQFLAFLFRSLNSIIYKYKYVVFVSVKILIIRL